MADSTQTIFWDKEEDRTYEHGVDHGILFTKNASGTYEASAWNGLSNVTLSPEGAEPTDIYADNLKYFTLLSAETLNLTIEAYGCPEAFKKCDGSAIGNGVSIYQQTREQFAFAFRTNGGASNDNKEHHKIFIVYNCVASPSERAYETINDSPDAIAFSWEVSTTPVVPTGTHTGTYKGASLVSIDEYKWVPGTSGAAGSWTKNTAYETVEAALLAGTFESLDAIITLLEATN